MLGDDDGRSRAACISLDKPANFRDPHHPEDPPSHVLVMSRTPGGTGPAGGHQHRQV
ncbi:MAG: hypothetical protein R3B46_05045 [Phycisphaerales bacterium]